MNPPRAGVAQAKRPKPNQPKPPAGEPRAAFQPQPFKPQRKLFVVLMIVFALWVAALLVMYFATVYPNRNQAPLTPPIPTGEGRLEGSSASADRFADTTLQKGDIPNFKLGMSPFIFC